MTLVVGGKPVPCEVEVKDWTEHGLQIRPGWGARPRQQKPDLVVLHWTGGEGTAAQLFANLQRKTLTRGPLGVEFCVDRAGMVWQFCDPTDVDTFDAGVANKRSVGVEVVSYGMRRLWQRIPPAGFDRVEYTCALAGRKPVRVAHFYDCQTTAIIALVRALVNAYGIEPRTPGVDGTLTPIQLDLFKGVCGHYHISPKKTDPGTALMHAVRDAL